MLRRSWLEKTRNASCSPSRSLIAGSTLVEVPLTGLSFKHKQCAITEIVDALAGRGDCPNIFLDFETSR